MDLFQARYIPIHLPLKDGASVKCSLYKVFLHQNLISCNTQLGCSSTPNKMIILQYHEVFFRLAAPTAMPAHLGAYNLEKTSWYRNIIILLGVEEHPNWEIVNITKTSFNNYDWPFMSICATIAHLYPQNLAEMTHMCLFYKMNLWKSLMISKNLLPPMLLHTVIVKFLVSLVCNF